MNQETETAFDRSGKQFAEKLAFRPQGLKPSQKESLYRNAGSAAPQSSTTTLRS